jgi:hypothetical protein
MNPAARSLLGLGIVVSDHDSLGIIVIGAGVNQFRHGPIIIVPSDPGEGIAILLGHDLTDALQQLQLAFRFTDVPSSEDYHA